MKIAIDQRTWHGIDQNNQGYDVTMLMKDWDADNWKWWAYQIKRIGLQYDVASALAQWDDDNSPRSRSTFSERRL